MQSEPVDPNAPPPVLVPPSGQKKAKPPGAASKAAKTLGPIAAFLAALGAKIKSIGLLLFSLLKYAKIGKVLLTGGTMLISMWFFSLAFGWLFAVGIVVLILVHEMGHVFFAWRNNIPVSAPIFLGPFGALIKLKDTRKLSPYVDSVVGFGGPLFGAIGATACWGIYFATGNLFFAALAYFTFFMNLFNLTPIYPLDGGRVIQVVSPYFWALGVLLILYFFFTGTLRNPFVFVLIILGLPYMWKQYQETRRGAPPRATKPQRITMGIAYVSLAGYLAIGMVTAGEEVMSHMSVRSKEVAPTRTRSSPPVAMVKGSKLVSSPEHFPGAL